MNAYRLSGTVAADLTITVQVPEASVGQEAEIIVLFPHLSETRLQAQYGSFEAFFKMLDESPPQKGTAEEDHALLRQSREEWD